MRVVTFVLPGLFFVDLTVRTVFFEPERVPELTVVCLVTRLFDAAGFLLALKPPVDLLDLIAFRLVQVPIDLVLVRLTVGRLIVVTRGLLTLLTLAG